MSLGACEDRGQQQQQQCELISSSGGLLLYSLLSFSRVPRSLKVSESGQLEVLLLVVHINWVLSPGIWHVRHFCWLKVKKKKVKVKKLKSVTRIWIDVCARLWAAAAVAALKRACPSLKLNYSPLCLWLGCLCCVCQQIRLIPLSLLKTLGIAANLHKDTLWAILFSVAAAFDRAFSSFFVSSHFALDCCWQIFDLSDLLLLLLTYNRARGHPPLSLSLYNFVACYLLSTQTTGHHTIVVCLFVCLLFLNLVCVCCRWRATTCQSSLS